MQTFFLTEDTNSSEIQDNITVEEALLLLENFSLKQEVKYNELIESSMIAEASILLNEAKDPNKVGIGERAIDTLKNFFSSMLNSLSESISLYVAFSKISQDRVLSAYGDLGTSIKQGIKNAPKSLARKERTYFVFDKDLKEVDKILKGLSEISNATEIKKARKLDFSFIDNVEEVHDVEKVVSFLRSCQDAGNRVLKDSHKTQAKLKDALIMAQRSVRDLDRKNRKQFEEVKKNREKISFIYRKANTLLRVYTKLLVSIDSAASRSFNSTTGELNLKKKKRIGIENFSTREFAYK